MCMIAAVEEPAHLAHLQIPLRELLQHILCAQRIVELLLQILNLRFSVRKLRLGHLISVLYQL